MHHNNNDSKIKNLVNTIVEVEIDGKMGLVSLYDDLPHFEYDQTIDNVSIILIKIEINAI